MKLSEDQLQKIAKCLLVSKRHRRRSLAEIRDILEVTGRDDYELDGHFAFPPTLRSFEPERIEELLEPTRFTELSRRGKPTSQEFDLWRAKWKSEIFTNEAGWYHFYLWKVDLPKAPIFFRSLHGDGGYLDHFHGPYRSAAEALADAGALEINQPLGETDVAN